MDVDVENVEVSESDEGKSIGLVGIDVHDARVRVVVGGTISGVGEIGGNLEESDLVNVRHS